MIYLIIIINIINHHDDVFHRNDYDHHYGINVYVSHLYDCGDALLNQSVFYPAHCDDAYLL